MDGFTNDGCFLTKDKLPLYENYDFKLILSTYPKIAYQIEEVFKIPEKLCTYINGLMIDTATPHGHREGFPLPVAEALFRISKTNFNEMSEAA